MDDFKGKYYIEINCKPFIFRQISRREYEGLLHKKPCDLQDAVCELAIVTPTDLEIDSLPCGIPDTLAQSILWASGFVGPEEVNYIIDQEKHNILCSPDLQMEAIIQYIYPDVTVDSMRDMSQRQLIKLFSKALYVIDFTEEQKTVINLNKIAEIRENVMSQQDGIARAQQLEQVANSKHAQRSMARNNMYNNGVM